MQTKIDLVQNTSWSWECDTKLGVFYVERRGKEFYAFCGGDMLHSAQHPHRSLASATHCCSDVYHHLMKSP